MKIAVCYVCVTQRQSLDLASRFVETYQAFPGGADHSLFVICNGGRLSSESSLVFASLRPLFWEHPNDPGWDITAWMDFANGPGACFDMMLCLGESAYFHRAGWLKRFAEVWDKLGPGMYGALSSNAVRPHLNTCAFTCFPRAFGYYPIRPSGKRERYNFEHGAKAFWRILDYHGVPVRLVTWDGEWAPPAWRFPENILWKGDQSNCLIWANHVDTYRKANRLQQERWARLAQQPFQ